MFNFFPEPTRHTELYETLGVKKDATTADIRRAYRVLAMKHHPDKGGTEATFKTITAAYEILSNDTTRKRYDMYGTDEPGNVDISDMFSSMFSGPPVGVPSPARIKPVVVEVHLSLDEVYRGIKRSVVYQAIRSCKTCGGKGGSGIRICGACRGKGAYIQMRQLGPGMIQQVHTKCETCRGKGHQLQTVCKTCDGGAYMAVPTTLEIAIKPNTTHGTRVTIGSMGHEVDGRFGDVCVTINIRKHGIFTQKGSDLHMTETIDLVQAICGYTFQVHHLNGTQTDIQSPVCIQPGSIQIIPGLGMTPTNSLHVLFRVVLPTHFDTRHKDRLVDLLASK
jgi:DnaJ-class molecular chaperone